MDEKYLSVEEKHPTEATTLVAEKNLQKSDHRLLIRTTDALGANSSELSEKLGCKTEIVINEMLSLGFKSVKALADGNNRIVISLKDGKLVFESFKDKQD